MKDMTSVATTMMTDEEKAEIEKQMNNNNPNASTPTVANGSKSAAQPTKPTTSSPPVPATTTSTSEKHPDGADPSPAPAPAAVPSSPTHTSHMVPHESSPLSPPSVTSTSLADKEAEKREAARRKAEQREKLREHEKARRKAMEARVAMLTKKMIERIRPFVEAKDPGAKNDAESDAFAERMKREVEDLKLESFGVEVSVLYPFPAAHAFTVVFLAPTHHWNRLYDEGIVFHEVKEILGNASVIFLRP